MNHITYNQYKNSNIYWVGDIPSHWDSIPVKHHFFSNKQVAGELANDYERLALTLKGVIKRSKEDAEGLQPEKFETYQIVRKNTLIFKLIDLENLRTSRVGLSKFDGLVSPAYIPLTANGDILPNFAEKYFLNMWHEHIFNQLGSVGVRSNLNKEDLLNIPIIKPPINEQENISNFLDKQIDKINLIIDKNNQLISLLGEKKVAIINKVVTKGLNPDAQMKDSGIEWIGEIPNHWMINKLSYYFKQLKNKNLSGNETNLLSLSYGKIVRKDINSNEGLLPENFDTYNIVDKDDIVLRLTDLQNDKKSLRTGLVTERGIITSAYVTIRPINPKININYIHYLLHCYDLTKVFYNMGGGVRQNLNYKELSYVQCLEPPYEEQKEIADYLDQELSKIDLLINKLNEHNSLCEEYKSSLIHYVVTGKIDVSDDV